MQPGPLLLLVLLAGCEVGLSAGYNLPPTDACRTASATPAKPISVECLDAIGGNGP